MSGPGEQRAVTNSRVPLLLSKPRSESCVSESAPETTPVKARRNRRVLKAIALLGLLVGSGGVGAIVASLLTSHETSSSSSISTENWCPGNLAPKTYVGVLERITLEGEDLRCADFRGAYLRDANLRGADLRGANLWQAELDGADLRNARLDGAYLSYADLDEADLRGAVLDGAVLSNVRLWEADLGTASLREANLRWAYVVGSDFRFADLSNADLRDATFERYDGDNPADFRDARLEGCRGCP